MEDSVTDSFDGVIFHNVMEYCSANDVINCHFAVKENCYINDPSDCYVGLFHVGWNTLSSCLTRKSFTLVEHLTSGLYSLEFHANETPKANYDEFYQFCFFNEKTEVVFGASCPFQICDLKHMESFTPVGHEDVWWASRNPNPVDEDVDDAVLIHNKTTMLEESLAKTVEENELLKTIKQKFEADLVKCCMDKEKYIKKSEEELMDLREKVKFQQDRANIFEQSLADSEEIINHLNGKIKDLKKYVAEYAEKLKTNEKSFAEISNEYEVVMMEKEILIKKFTESIQLNEEEIKKSLDLEEKFKTHLQTFEAIKKKLECEKSANANLELEYQDMVLSFTKQIEALSKENSDSKELHDRIADMDNKLNAEKKKNSSLLVDVNNLETVLENAEAEQKKGQLTFQSEKSRLLEIIEERSNFIQQLNNEKEELLKKLKEEEKKCLKMIEKNRDVVSKMESKIDESESTFSSVKLDLMKQQEEFSKIIGGKDAYIGELEENFMSSKSEVAELHEIIAQQQQNANKSIAEFKAKETELNQLLEDLNSKQNLSKKPTKSRSSGSLHALQVATAHMQKQVTNLKKEKDSFQKMYNQQNLGGDVGTQELRRVNDEMRLRLHLGKEKYKEKYLECQHLQMELEQLRNENKQNNTNNVHEGEKTEMVYVAAHFVEQMKIQHIQELDKLKSEKEVLEKKYSEAQNDLTKSEQEMSDLSKDVEGMKVKTKKLAEHYEGKIKLMVEENGVLKKQRDAVLVGDSNVMTQEKPVEQETLKSCDAMIYHPPSGEENRVIHQQPDVWNEIMYPPSLNVIGGRNKNAWLPGAVPTSHIKAKDISAKHDAPPTQVIPRHKSSQAVLAGRGKTVDSSYQQPTYQCPVCNMAFPPGFSDVSATHHVNSHFNDKK